MPIILTFIAALLSIIGTIIVLRTGKANKKILSMILAFSSGIMITVAFWDILPEAFQMSKIITSLSFIIAIIFFFITENFIIINSCNEYIEDCHLHTITILSIIALSIHSLLDGFNIGIGLILGKIAGLNIFLAIILHKIADGITLAAIMKHSSENDRKIFLTSIFISIATPIGTALSYYLKLNLSNLIPLGLGIASASFTYISMTEIIPNLHKERNYLLPIMFLIGCLIVFTIHIILE